MPRFKLVPHPETPQSAIIAMWVNVRRRADKYLFISFYVTGTMEEIAWPGRSASGGKTWTRADELWRHSCFEVFGAVAGEPGYFEVNLATSGRWAAYGFLGYRDGMGAAENIGMIKGNWRIRPHKAELHAVIETPRDYEGADWLLGPSAVIEAGDQTISYWALAHPPGPPDFHHPDCFALELPSPVCE